MHGLNRGVYPPAGVGCSDTAFVMTARVSFANIDDLWQDECLRQAAVRSSSSERGALPKRNLSAHERAIQQCRCEL